jgi:hypothetical protein
MSERGHRTLSGACPCGALRFELGAVFDCRYCHCAHCRRTSGAPFTVAAVVRPADFHLAAGSLAASRRGDKGVEQRCASCRAEVAFEFETSLGTFLSVPVGLLDDPDACPPRYHQWFSQRLHWMHVHDSLPKYADERVPPPQAVEGAPRKG